MAKARCNHRNKNKKATNTTTGGFVRKTITIAPEHVDFFFEQAAQPQHSGNASSFVRSLIIDAKQASLVKKEAA